MKEWAQIPGAYGPNDPVFFTCKTLFCKYRKTKLKKEDAHMKTKQYETLAVQTLKKQRLDREFSWISREFENFLTLADLDVENAPYKQAVELGLAE